MTETGFWFWEHCTPQVVKGLFWLNIIAAFFFEGKGYTP